MGYIGNQDYTIIETHIGNVTGKDTEANILLKAPTSGELWVGIDTGKLYLADGFSWIDIGTLQGETGPQGPRGNSITSIARTSGDGSLNTIDTYTITYSDGTTSTFNVTNGASIVGINGSDTEANILTRTGDPVNTLYVATDTRDGWLYDGATWNNIGPIQGNGVTSITRTSGNGLPGETDTYTITMTDGTTQTFDVYNGKDLTNVSVIDDVATSLTSAWSSQKISNELSSLDVSPLLQPAITNPANGTIDFIGNVTATYNTSESYAGVQDWVLWEASTDANFTNIVGSYEGSSNLTSWVPTIGLALTDIYVRTKQGSDGHRSKYSDAIKFTTPDTYIIAPTLTVPGAPSSVTLTPLLTGSAFDVYNGSDTHVSTDWQVLKASDNSVVWESLNDTQNLLSITTGTLSINTNLVFRVRYNGAIYGSSAWTEVTAQTLNIYVQDPVLTVAGYPDSLTLSPALSTSAFVVVNGTASHVSTDWEIRKVSDNSLVWSSIGNTTNKTSITPSGLKISTQYKVRVKHNSNLYGSSNWVEVTGTTLNIYVENPTITVEGTPDDVPKNPTISGSAFSVMNGTDTHEATDYQVVRVSDGVVVWESLGNTTNKTSIRTGDLVKSTAYIFKMRYKGTTYGYSQWVQVTGTTKAVFSVAYGVEWNSANDTYLRTGAASGVANSTSYAGAIQIQMRRCVLNVDGTVKYYLHPTDSTKKADGTPAIINGTDGNVMVEIPKFWYKYEHVSGVHKWSISDGNHGPDYEVHPAFIRGGVEKDYRYYPAYEGFNLSGKLISGSGRTPTVNQTRAQFRTLAAANGAGWSQIDWNLLVAVQLLYLTEYANFNSQAMIGRGNDAGSDYTMTTGGSNSIGNASSPSTNNDTWMSYRGIENWYASMFKFIDGVNVQERKYFINNKPATFADDVFTGDYVDSGITSVASNGYVSNLVPNKKGFVASAVAGSDSTYVPDYFYQSTGNRVVFFGGHASVGLYCGAFYLYAGYAASEAYATIGSGVSF